ncbi:Mic26 protein [Saccharomycopsis crataegensis]|uniref:MICOS complex subunit n=1 Tax=Saccharomycopsis crataegensis TaxID=43959 RepID=A0AAV5QEC8_9ASCO|nr:Mic26 protein [Saccharomycopsis crataegensis]
MKIQAITENHIGEASPLIEGTFNQKMSFPFAKAFSTTFVGLAGLALLPSYKVHNESKRNFYEDDDNVTPIPGTIVPASASEIESLGPNKLVDGISVRSPDYLEGFFNKARKSTVDVLKSAESGAEGVTKDYYDLEHHVTGTVAKLHDRREDLLPGGLYIVTGILTGSIIARRRGPVARVLLPAVVGLAVFRWTLPITFANTTGFVYHLEQQNVPAVANAQDSIVSGVERSIEAVESTTSSTIKSVDSAIECTKNYIASITGLNIGQNKKN